MADNEIIKHSDLAEVGAVKPLTDEFIALLKVLDSVDGKVIQLAKDLKVTLSATSNDSSAGIKRSTKAYEDANRVLDLRQKTLKEIKMAESKLTESMEAESRELARLRLELERVNAENKKLAKEQSTTTGEYEKAALKLIRLRKTWKDLAIANRENTVEAKALKKELDALDTTLKKVDAAAGQHQRNVGNYSGSFNGLQNSINQVTRELPAFTNSLQTGFMGISNNIPMLVDQMNALKRANAEMAASGEKTIPVWKQMLKGVFSWQTALSVGITLLTVYGAEVVKWIGGLFGVVDASEKAAKAQEDLNEQLDGTIERLNKFTQEWISNIDFQTQALIIAAKKRGASLDEIRAIEEKGRVNEIEKVRNQVERFTTLWGGAYSDLREAQSKYADDDSENNKKILDNAKEREAKLLAQRNSAQEQLDKLENSNRLKLRQNELEDIEKNRETNKKISEDRKKALEDDAKERDKYAKLALKLEQEILKLRVEQQKKETEEERKKLDDRLATLDDMRARVNKFRIAQAEKDAKLEEDNRKNQQRQVTQSIDLLDKAAKSENQIQNRKIDVELENSKRRQDELRNLAVRGSLDANKSLAFEERKQAELEAKRTRALKNQKRQELLFAGLKAYSANVEKNPTTALGTTLKDLTVLSSSLAAIPGFIEGTENVADSLGKPQLPGRDGYIVRVDGEERIVNPSGNKKIKDEIGNITNQQLIDLAIMGSKSIAPNIPIVMHYDDDRQIKKLDDVRNEIKELKSVIENRPIKDFRYDDVSKMAYDIVKSKLKVETTKKRVL